MTVGCSDREGFSHPLWNIKSQKFSFLVMVWIRRVIRIRDAWIRTSLILTRSKEHSLLCDKNGSFQIKISCKLPGLSMIQSNRRVRHTRHNNMFFLPLPSQTRPPKWYTRSIQHLDRTKLHVHWSTLSGPLQTHNVFAFK